MMCERGTVQQGKETISEAQEGAVRSHQPDETVFKSILSEDVDWKPFPALPPSVRLAVVSFGAWPLRDQGEGAPWRQVDAA